MSLITWPHEFKVDIIEEIFNNNYWRLSCFIFSTMELGRKSTKKQKIWRERGNTQT